LVAVAQGLTIVEIEGFAYPRRRLFELLILDLGLVNKALDRGEL
jgi:hypothetical protein